MNVLDLIKLNRLTLLGILLGGLGGFCYWYFIGCSSRTCPITSSPIISTIWGAIMGSLIFSIVKKDEKKDL